MKDKAFPPDIVLEVPDNFNVQFFVNSLSLCNDMHLFLVNLVNQKTL